MVLIILRLILISTFALDFIHSDRSIFKIVDLDEAWAFLNVAQGETLSNKLVRAKKICLSCPLRSPVGQCILHNSKQTDKVFEILQGYGRQVGSLQLAVKRVYRWQLFCRG